MNEEKHSTIRWMDVLWLIFLLGLAALPPVGERHKQLALLAIGWCSWPKAESSPSAPRYRTARPLSWSRFYWPRC